MILHQGLDFQKCLCDLEAQLPWTLRQVLVPLHGIFTSKAKSAIHSWTLDCVHGHAYAPYLCKVWILCFAGHRYNAVYTCIYAHTLLLLHNVSTTISGMVFQGSVHYWETPLETTLCFGDVPHLHIFANSSSLFSAKVSGRHGSMRSWSGSAPVPIAGQIVLL